MTPEEQPLSVTFARITVFGLIGAVVGLVVGLVVMAIVSGGFFENPFWLMAAGLFVGAMVAPIVPRR